MAAAQSDSDSGQGRLILLRHAQGMLGTDDYDRLSPTGKTQAALLGLRMATMREQAWPVWSGALRRHRQTLGSLAAAGVVHIDPCLNEYRVDHLLRSAREQADALGLRSPPDNAFDDPVRFLDAFMAWFPCVLETWQLGRLHDPGNGTWVAFSQRVAQAVPTWQRQLARGRSVVVVTSAGVISTLVAALCGYDLEWQRQCNVSLYNASVTELNWVDGERWEIKRLNCVDHLAEQGLQTLA